MRVFSKNFLISPLAMLVLSLSPMAVQAAENFPGSEEQINPALKQQIEPAVQNEIEPQCTGKRILPGWIHEFPHRILSPFEGELRETYAAREAASQRACQQIRDEIAASQQALLRQTEEDMARAAEAEQAADLSRKARAASREAEAVEWMRGEDIRRQAAIWQHAPILVRGGAFSCRDQDRLGYKSP